MIGKSPIVIKSLCQYASVPGGVARDVLKRQLKPVQQRKKDKTGKMYRQQASRRESEERAMTDQGCDVEPVKIY